MADKMTESEVVRAVWDGFADAGADPRANVVLIAEIAADTLAALHRDFAALSRGEVRKRARDHAAA